MARVGVLRLRSDIDRSGCYVRLFASCGGPSWRGSEHYIHSACPFPPGTGTYLPGGHDCFWPLQYLQRWRASLISRRGLSLPPPPHPPHSRVLRGMQGPPVQERLQQILTWGESSLDHARLCSGSLPITVPPEVTPTSVLHSLSPCPTVTLLAPALLQDTRPTPRGLLSLWQSSGVVSVPGKPASAVRAGCASGGGSPQLLSFTSPHPSPVAPNSGDPVLFHHAPALSHGGSEMA